MKSNFRKVASRKTSIFVEVPEDINIFRPRFPGLMKNKKGFIRILEAIFAILIIMGAVLILISNNVQTSDISERAYEKQRHILDIISNNEVMRDEVINYNPGSDPPGPLTQTRELIKKTIPSSWKFSVCVNLVEEVCTPVDTPSDKELYVSETIISSSLNADYSGAKKLRLFIWRTWLVSFANQISPSSP